MPEEEPEVFLLARPPTRAETTSWSRMGSSASIPSKLQDRESVPSSSAEANDLPIRDAQEVQASPIGSVGKLKVAAPSWSGYNGQKSSSE